MIICQIKQQSFQKLYGGGGFFLKEPGAWSFGGANGQGGPREKGVTLR